MMVKRTRGFTILELMVGLTIMGHAADARDAVERISVSVQAAVTNKHRASWEGS